MRIGAALSLVSAGACAALVSLVAAISAAQSSHPSLQSQAPSVEPSAPPLIQLGMSEQLAPNMPDATRGLMHLDLSVTDKAGGPVSGLAGKDFTLLDDEQERKVVTFEEVDGASARASEMTEVVLVIDELNMVPKARAEHGTTADDPRDQATAKERLAFADAMREARTFLLADGGRLQAPTIVYRLTTDGLFVTPHASMNGNEIVNEIENPKSQDRIWSPSQVTKDIGNLTKGGAVSWRVTHSIVALGSIAIEERRKLGRKLVFWIGNGWQIDKRRAEGLVDVSAELLTRIREARISLWGSSEWPVFDADGNPVPVVNSADKQFLEGPQSKSAFDPTDLNFLSLPVIAVRSGGGMITVARNLGDAIRERVRQAKSFYSLTFDPPPTAVVDEYHHLKVAVDRADLSAHTYLDYYDEPVFYDQQPRRRQITVKMLEEAIVGSGATDDAALGNQLQGMELMERLSTARLLELQNQVHGKKAREALEVIADQSMFLKPPEDQILSAPKPDLATQKQMILRAGEYVRTVIPKFPDVFATRTTVQYHESPTKKEETWKTATGDESLHEGEIEHAAMRIRNGREDIEQVSRKHVPSEPGGQMLRTIGTFGPILAAVLTAATSPHSEIVWSRWEKGIDGPMAVFRYQVPQETPLFSAEFCCLAIDFENAPFKKNAPFHGEIAVNPMTGAIMRLTIQADLEERLPLHRSDVVVEYAPVVRGTRTFICPSRSVSISRQRKTAVIHEWGEDFKVYAPFETILNEMRFEKYRIFGSTSRILPDFTEVDEKK